MREILFRGKSEKTGKWIYGNLNVVADVCCEISSCFELVDGTWYLKEHEKEYVVPETVGQYANKDDIHGKKIFDGDIIQVPFWRKKGTGLFMKGIVEFHNSAFSVLWEYADYGRSFIGYIDDIEVIGNVHDNP